MKRRVIFVAAALATALPLPVNATSASGEPDTDGATIAINNVTPSQIEKLCKPGTMINVRLLRKT